jgi:tRNA (cytidine/uridine-2'-O-)-methyltransferase
MRIVLVEPQIPQNTGSVGRLCAGHDVPLHLVEPIGFQLTDKYLKRAGLDYWPHIQLKLHPSLDDVLQNYTAPRWFFSARAERDFWDVSFGPDDLLIFGREADGLPEWVKEQHQDRLVGIPHNGNIRSLNLATTVGVALYEALRQQRG